jgi:hypothetical protein
VTNLAPRRRHCFPHCDVSCVAAEEQLRERRRDRPHHRRSELVRAMASTSGGRYGVNANAPASNACFLFHLLSFLMFVRFPSFFSLLSDCSRFASHCSRGNVVIDSASVFACFRQFSLLLSCPPGVSVIWTLFLFFCSFSYFRLRGRGFQSKNEVRDARRLAI